MQIYRKKNPKSFNTLEPKLSLRFTPHKMNDNSNGYNRIDISNVFKWNLNKEEFAMLQKASEKCLKKMPSNPFSSL